MLKHRTINIFNAVHHPYYLVDELEKVFVCGHLPPREKNSKKYVKTQLAVIGNKTTHSIYIQHTPFAPFSIYAFSKTLSTKAIREITEKMPEVVLGIAYDDVHTRVDGSGFRNSTRAVPVSKDSRLKHTFKLKLEEMLEKEAIFASTVLSKREINGNTISFRSLGKKDNINIAIYLHFLIFLVKYLEFLQKIPIAALSDLALETQKEEVKKGTGETVEKTDILLYFRYCSIMKNVLQNVLLSNRLLRKIKESFSWEELRDLTFVLCVFTRFSRYKTYKIMNIFLEDVLKDGKNPETVRNLMFLFSERRLMEEFISITDKISSSFQRKLQHLRSRKRLEKLFRGSIPFKNVFTNSTLPVFVLETVRNARLALLQSLKYLAYGFKELKKISCSVPSCKCFKERLDNIEQEIMGETRRFDSFFEVKIELLERPFKADGHFFFLSKLKTDFEEENFNIFASSLGQEKIEEKNETIVVPICYHPYFKEGVSTVVLYKGNPNTCRNRLVQFKFGNSPVLEKVEKVIKSVPTKISSSGSDNFNKKIMSRIAQNLFEYYSRRTPEF